MGRTTQIPKSSEDLCNQWALMPDRALWEELARGRRGFTLPHISAEGRGRQGLTRCSYPGPCDTEPGLTAGRKMAPFHSKGNRGPMI